MKKSKSDWQPLEFDNMQTVSLLDRPSKVGVADFARPWEPGGSLQQFMATLPGILAADLFKQVVDAIATAVRRERVVLLGMGAHPIKVGLNPVLINAMERGIITGLALNGAGVIHDVELALAGKTSEDVAAHLEQGQFGAARETAEFIHGAAKGAYAESRVGLGRAVGRRLLQEAAPYAGISLLAAAAKLEVPVTVHVALGTDIIHMHPAMDGAVMGALSYLDFKLFCRLVANLEAGVYINLGSAVILPEVFLKAVSVAINMGYSLSGITTINMDFQRHYRTQLNVLDRPAAGRGVGINLIGHHEIMFPLLMAAIIDRLSESHA